MPNKTKIERTIVKSIEKELPQMAKNTQKNQLECNKQARKRYTEKNFKYQTVCFKNEEIEAINAYCEKHSIPKNTFFREACSQYMTENSFMNRM